MKRKILINERANDSDHEDLGWCAVENEDGEVWIERAVAHDETNYPWSEVTLYRVEVPADVYAEFDWVRGVSGVRRAAGRDESPTMRAWEVYALGEEVGWIELDHDPLNLSRWELAQRWGNAPEYELPEGDAQVEATNAAFTLFRLATEGAVDVAKALTDGMARVRRMRGVSKSRWYGIRMMPKFISTFETDYPREEHSVYVAVSIDCAEIEVGEVKRMGSNPKNE